ncbi:MAG: TrkH family potassium uptake protein [Rhizobiales bacterium]|nr:TrkH family potassium uptake protein [Hyphomicrobiales bacterium]
MIDPRPITLVVGVLSTTLGAVMLIPALVDLAYGAPGWTVFAVSSLITLFIGGAMTLATWGRAGNLSIRQAFVLTTAAWVALALFAALPLWLGEAGLSFTDAVFESMSGITTTGATVVTGLDSMSRGFLLWRALLQWLGGIGIIVMAVAVLPMLQVGGMQLFRLESSDTSEKILPRATQIASSITGFYVSVTLICAAAYRIFGMDTFDAVVHAMTTIATGGYSSHDASFAFFANPAVEMVAVVFMIAGSLPFILYLQAMSGKPGLLVRDTQVQWFVGSAAALVIVALIYQLSAGISAPLTAMRHAAFNVVSIMTGTGYASVDYGHWGTFAVGFFFFIMFIGGCAGSTSCGIKIFRFQVLFQHMRVQLARVSYPHGVFTPHYNGRPIPDQASRSVMAFFLLFFVCFALLAVALGMLGLDGTTALSAAASAIANVGPGLGEIVGPAGNYASLPELAKWLLCLGMLLGRLELFTVLVLFTPAFWRN